MDAANPDGSFDPIAQWKNGKYIRYFYIFHTYGIISRCRLLPMESELSYRMLL